jgi:cytochrome c oxidase subunit 4
MEPGLGRKAEQRAEKAGKGESAAKHVFSFAWMILFTVIAFIVVEYQILNPEQTFWLILGLAVLQVILQMFTFMHLDRKGFGIVIIFISIGIFIATVAAVGIVLM